MVGLMAEMMVVRTVACLVVKLDDEKVAKMVESLVLYWAATTVTHSAVQ